MRRRNFTHVDSTVGDTGNTRSLRHPQAVVCFHRSQQGQSPVMPVDAGVLRMGWKTVVTRNRMRKQRESLCLWPAWALGSKSKAMPRSCVWGSSWRCDSGRLPPVGAQAKGACLLATSWAWRAPHLSNVIITSQHCTARLSQHCRQKQRWAYSHTLAL